MRLFRSLFLLSQGWLPTLFCELQLVEKHPVPLGRPHHQQSNPSNFLQRQSGSFSQSCVILQKGSELGITFWATHFLA